MTWACWVQIVIGVKAAYRGEKLSAVARIEVLPRQMALLHVLQLTVAQALGVPTAV
jgi:hypothetical protein